MNFEDAIKAHAAWKMKLKTYIEKPDGTLKADVVCKDNNCELGKWIHSDGQKQLGKLADFDELKKQHAQFHKCAGDIIRRADAGEKVKEEVAIGAKSEFSQASTQVTTLLMKLRSSAAA